MALATVVALRRAQCTSRREFPLQVQLGAIAAPPAMFTDLLGTTASGMLYHHDGDKLCRLTIDSVVRATLRD